MTLSDNTEVSIAKLLLVLLGPNQIDLPKTTNHIKKIQEISKQKVELSNDVRSELIKTFDRKNEDGDLLASDIAESAELISEYLLDDSNLESTNPIENLIDLIRGTIWSDDLLEFLRNNPIKEELSHRWKGVDVQTCLENQASPFGECEGRQDFRGVFVDLEFSNFSTPLTGLNLSNSTLLNIYSGNLTLRNCLLNSSIIANTWLSSLILEKCEGGNFQLIPASTWGIEFIKCKFEFTKSTFSTGKVIKIEDSNLRNINLENSFPRLPVSMKNSKISGIMSNLSINNLDCANQFESLDLSEMNIDWCEFNGIPMNRVILSDPQKRMIVPNWNQRRLQLEEILNRWESLGTTDKKALARNLRAPMARDLEQSEEERGSRWVRELDPLQSESSRKLIIELYKEANIPLFELDAAAPTSAHQECN